MRAQDMDGLLLDEIMTRWPQVQRVFIDWHLHCIVCPVTGFHTLADSAAAHGYPIEPLREAVLRVINDRPETAAPPVPPWRPARASTHP